uniref:Photosystem I reaction center subunit XI n=1 Tax=Cyanidium caldarium TaxID=2771 RepID=PSAL_CYACA|nr:photosystem I subunit XI [Cyanidium caldarium]Q9TM17.1 RecName: Full=Photosystem I reaction center subunit XI; AltName: Full=PSI subunit V; AltName: Full=PSI-L [Cyanidium caldarium]AAF12996.1 unknown [Cyanidium caldarium]WDB00177.1 photosystem I subunit XI [Cyanidium caldarium]
MINYIKPYGSNPFVGNLSTPVNSSKVTIWYLKNLPIYRRGLSPLLRGLEIGMAHGYFIIGPFYKLGPLRNTDLSLLSGLIAAIGLIIISSIAMIIYGIVTFDNSENNDKLQTANGWRQLASGFLLGAVGGAGFAYILLANNLLSTSTPILQT